MRIPNIVLILVLSICSGLSKVHAQEYRIFIHPTSNVTVYGSTNINTFKFVYTEEIAMNRPVRVVQSEGVLRLSGGIINLKIRAFDSGNGMMNKDFRSMLKEEDDPFINVELKALKPDWKNEAWREGKADIIIKMNQVEKTYTVNCKVQNPGSLLIYGRQRVQLIDFGLTPPVRMMGMVKVSEWVDLDFSLRFATDR
ncbi:MAG: hypothetical protein KF687_11420 [Cyclobacteriaceae bacterium]|nr:hypothetical protein [Cyclobacteriaceae bacterium]